VEPVIELATTFLAQVNRDENAYAEYGPHFYQDPRAIEITRIIETQLGVKRVQLLGGGSYGTAAATQDRGGEVLKLTTDTSEVQAATVLHGVPAERYPKNVVRITGAWFLRKIKVEALTSFHPDGREITGSVRIGLIRMERVHPLEDMQAAHGLANWTRYVKHKFKVWPWQLKGISREKQRERMLAAGQEMERMLMQLWNDQHDQIARDVARGIGQLRAEGIYGTDFHGGNVGFAFVHELPPSPPPPHPPTIPFRENPVTEETLEYKGVKFDLITLTRNEVAEYYVRIGFESQWGPFDFRNKAIDFAHDKIDELQPTRPRAPTPEELGARIYKLFDVGQSSIPGGSPRPEQIPAIRRRTKRESEQLVLPLVKERVKVAELG
jgi:hypothetical protein